MLVPVNILPLTRLPEHIYLCSTLARERGPTDEFPDPLKANFTAHEVFKGSLPKRKAPHPKVLVDKQGRKDGLSFFSSIASEDLSEAENSMRMIKNLFRTKMETTKRRKLISPDTNCPITTWQVN